MRPVSKRLVYNDERFILADKVSKIYLGKQGVQDLSWQTRRPRFILADKESKIYLGRQGVQILINLHFSLFILLGNHFSFFIFDSSF
jgi:hypothetical protein